MSAVLFSCCFSVNGHCNKLAQHCECATEDEAKLIWIAFLKSILYEVIFMAFCLHSFRFSIYSTKSSKQFRQIQWLNAQWFIGNSFANHSDQMNWKHRYKFYWAVWVNFNANLPRITDLIKLHLNEPRTPNGFNVVQIKHSIMRIYQWDTGSTNVNIFIAVLEVRSKSTDRKLKNKTLLLAIRSTTSNE